jgi:hypothetical protein
MKKSVWGHFQSIFGKPIARVGDPGVVDLWLWPGGHEGEKHFALTTVGMSAKAMKVPAGSVCFRPEPRVELMTYLLDLEHRHLLVDPLRGVASYPFARETFIHFSHTLPLERPLAKGSALDHLYFTFPLMGKDQATFPVNEAEVDLLLALPISTAEQTFAERAGTDAFDALLNGRAVAELFDPFRKSLV